MSTIPNASPQEPEYAWEIARLFPAQGGWSEADYVDLTDHHQQGIELANDRLEFLPMPTLIHQLLGRYLFLTLFRYVDSRQLGEVHYSGIRIRIRPGLIREPDIVFVHRDHYHLRHNRVWDGADLVMEVVSDDAKDRQRDLVQKRIDYAAAGIAEYWIVDPVERRVIVNQLVNGAYAVAGEYLEGTQAESCLLPGMTVDVAALLAVMNDVPE